MVWHICPQQNQWQRQLQCQAFNDITGKWMPLTWRFQDSRDVSIHQGVTGHFVHINEVHTSSFQASYIRKDKEHTAPPGLYYRTYQCHPTRCKQPSEWLKKSCPGDKKRRKKKETNFTQKHGSIFLLVLEPSLDHQLWFRDTVSRAVLLKAVTVQLKSQTSFKALLLKAVPHLLIPSAAAVTNSISQHHSNSHLWYTTHSAQYKTHGEAAQPATSTHTEALHKTYS